MRASKVEDKINALVDGAQNLLGELWDPVEGIPGEPKPWRLCAQELRRAAVNLTKAAVLCDGLAGEEKR
jgi:hypothetical protein